jgi:hypothetical protein
MNLSERGSETFLLGYTEALPRKKIPSMPDDFYRETEDRLAVNLLVGALTFRPARFSRKLERSPCEN